MRIDFKRAKQFVNRNRNKLICGFAIAGDTLVPGFGDIPSYESALLFWTGESILLFGGRGTGVFSLAYTLFGLGMGNLARSAGVQGSSAIKFNLITFAIVDGIWASRYLLGQAGVWMRRHGSQASKLLYIKKENSNSKIAKSSYALIADALKKHSDSHKRYSACRILCHIANRIKPLAGLAATALHITGTAFAEKSGGKIETLMLGPYPWHIPKALMKAFGDPSNIILLTGHGLWVSADGLAGNFGKMIHLLKRWTGLQKPVRQPR